MELLSSTVRRPLRQRLVRPGLLALYFPACLLLGAFFFYPLLKVGLISVDAPHFTLAHYAEFLTDPVNIQVTTRTVELTAYVTTLTLALGYPTAAFLSSLSQRAQRILLVCVAVPYLTSLLVRTYAWVLILGDDGAINHLLLAAGWISDPLPLLYSRFGMLLGTVHVMLPMMVLPLYASMQRLDRSLLRAARSLGGGALQTFFRVYLPQTMPGVRSGCTLVFVVSLGLYIIPMALGGLGDVMLSTMIAQQVTTAGNFSMAAVMALALLAVAAVVFLSLRVSTRLFLTATRTTAQSSAARPTLLVRMTASLACRLRARCLNRPAASGSAGVVLLGVTGVSTLVFLVLPSVIVLVVSFGNADMISFPPAGLSFRWYASFFHSPEWLGASWLSARIAALSTAVALTVGTMAAFASNRVPNLKVRAFASGALMVPLVIPPVVFAIGSFSVLASWGMVGTTPALVFVHACLCVPLVVVVMSGALAGFDQRLERASLSLGHSRISTLFRVVLPLMLPAVFAAALFSFVTSFDEVVVTSFIAGDAVRTLPLKMFEDVRNQVDPTIAAVSALLIGVPFLCLPFIGALGGRSRKA
ncbi:ABC transporter permease subunit [Burkholderia ubonensis]|uniref:ABC transporter permease subunit n=1 Tax=Burkholderia ubonensis TaxID=101571 RepID=UPI002ABE48DB|nr:ABC transporter permease subunit [Burkholderia ubonensis]